MYDFVLPDIGEGISEALLIKWFVKAGDRIEEGEDLATISTDKVDVELPSPRSGTVSELCWKPGDTIQVGSVFLRIDTGEIEEPKPAAAGPEAKAEPKPVAKQPASENRIVAAPSTRKHAKDLGVDLATLTGSGPAGRILRSDVDAASSVGRPVAPGAPESVRRAMAERMAHSVHTLAHSTMNFEARADGFLELLDKLAPDAERRGLKVSPTALFAKCVATALRGHPRFNATIDEDRCDLDLHGHVNLSIALASERGLLVPVINRIDEMPLFAIARALADITERGRSGALAPGDVKGGTFTLSNTGNMERAEITSTRPVINAPQTAILWVSRIAERPRVTDGVLEAGPMVNCSLSFDHRFIDGAETVAFINDLAGLIECPERALAAD